MDVFDLDRTIIDDYARFARSFSLIKAADIKASVDALYAAGRFWPPPLISINPRYKRGLTVEALAADGALHPKTAKVFGVSGRTLQLHPHRRQAVVKGATGQSFVVTSGAGSGKSPCFFMPIVDAAIRARDRGEAPSTRKKNDIARYGDYRTAPRVLAGWGAQERGR